MLKDKSLLKSTLFIGGKWLDSGKTGLPAVDVKSPINGSSITKLARIKNLTEVFQYAKEEQSRFARTTALYRANLLEKWHDLILENQKDLSKILMLESGKKDALAEIKYASGFVKWFAEQARRIEGSIIESPNSNHYFVMKRPVGICVAITPWNFPAAMVTRKIAPMLAAGCCVIVKPSDKTPLTALALAELANRAGFGSQIQVINGDAPTLGKQLCQSPAVRKVSFTGSAKIGKILMSYCAENLTKLSLELGGNSPFIVFEDADVELAIEQIRISKFRNAGQTCTSPNRFYIHNSIYKDFAQKLKDVVSRMKVGFEEDCDFGCLIDMGAVDRIQTLISDALSKGAQLLLGDRPAGQSNQMPATILTHVNHQMKVVNEEIFGPVIPLIPFKSDDEVLALSNMTSVGLAAYLFTKDSKRQWRFINELEFGMVGVNDSSNLSNEAVPFGGIKHSGMGREGSKWGIEEYLELKTICLNP